MRKILLNIHSRKAKLRGCCHIRICDQTVSLAIDKYVTLTSEFTCFKYNPFQVFVNMTDLSNMSKISFVILG